MEHIPGYDTWKATSPDEPEPVDYCKQCGDPLWEGDEIYAIDGGICEECLKNGYRRFV